MEMKFEIINCIILLWLYNMLTSWGRTSQKKSRNASSESLSNSYYNCNVQYKCICMCI